MRRKTAQFQNTQSVQLQPQAQVNEAQPIQIEQQHQAQVRGVQSVQLQPQVQFQNTKSVQFQPQNQVHVAQPVQIQQQQQGQVYRTQSIQLQQQSQAQYQNIQSVSLQPQAQIPRAQQIQLMPQEQFQFQSTQQSHYKPQALGPQCQPLQVLTTPYQSMTNIANLNQFRPEHQNKSQIAVQDDIQSYNQMMKQTKWQRKMNNSNYFNFSQKGNTRILSSNDINLNDGPTIYESIDIIVQLPELSKQIIIQDPPQNENKANTRETPPELVNYFVKLNKSKVESLDLLLIYLNILII